MRTLWVIGLFAAAVAACKGPNAKIEALRDGLAADDATALDGASAGFPACKEPFTAPADKGCLTDLAHAFGSKSDFNGKSPDQASAASVALVVARDKRGDWLASVTGADVWLGAMRTGKGPGADSLRLAVARQMAAGAPDVGNAIDDEKDTPPLLKAVAAAVPGACATYQMLGAGADDKTMAIPDMPDHSACVQKDLARKDGPGGTYGRGKLRAAEGAVALWKDAARAVREGLAQMSGAPRATVEAKLGAIDAATAKIALKKVPREDGWIKDMTDLHGDAGVPLDGKTPSKPDAGTQRRR